MTTEDNGRRNERNASNESNIPSRRLIVWPLALIGLTLASILVANAVSAWGAVEGTTPTIDRLASEGVLFVDATSPSTWSLPSHASLFTGRYPSSHGAHGEHLELDQRFPTLAQVLVARGYGTFCFTSNAWISDGLGLTRGFDWQDGSWKEEGGAGRNFVFIYRLLDRIGLLRGDKGGARVADNFSNWMRERPRNARPSFVFLNFIEAHFPYHQLPIDYAKRYTDRPMSELKDLSMALMAQQFGTSIFALRRGNMNLLPIGGFKAFFRRACNRLKFCEENFEIIKNSFCQNCCVNHALATVI